MPAYASLQKNSIVPQKLLKHITELDCCCGLSFFVLENKHGDCSVDGAIRPHR